MITHRERKFYNCNLLLCTSAYRRFENTNINNRFYSHWRFVFENVMFWRTPSRVRLVINTGDMRTKTKEKIKSSPEKVTQTYKECWQALYENVKKCKRRKVLVIIIPRHNKAPAVCWPSQFFIAHGANENLSDIIFRWIIKRTSKRLL